MDPEDPKKINEKKIAVDRITVVPKIDISKKKPPMSWPVGQKKNLIRSKNELKKLKNLMKNDIPQIKEKIIIVQRDRIGKNPTSKSPNNEPINQEPTTNEPIVNNPTSEFEEETLPETPEGSLINEPHERPENPVGEENNPSTGNKRKKTLSPEVQEDKKKSKKDFKRSREEANLSPPGHENKVSRDKESDSEVDLPPDDSFDSPSQEERDRRRRNQSSSSDSSVRSPRHRPRITIEEEDEEQDTPIRRGWIENFFKRA